MGRIGKILELVSSKLLKFDISTGDTKLGTVFTPNGDDSKPLVNDKVITIKSHITGKYHVVGFYDANDQITNPGEKRIYSRDSNNNIVSEVYLHSDGMLEMKNSNGGLTINADGSISINGILIDPSGNITNVPSLETTGSVNLVTHTHTQAADSNGNAQQPTSEPV